MRESDAAYGLLCELDRTLTDVRGRLADLALLAEGPPAPAVVVLPPEAPCAPEVPPPLVLPADVEAPPVVVERLDETQTGRQEQLSAR